MSYTVQRSTQEAEPQCVLQHVLQSQERAESVLEYTRRRAGGTDGCRHQSLKAEASALLSVRRKGTLFGGSSERKAVMAISLSFQGPAREGVSRTLPRPESPSSSV